MSKSKSNRPSQRVGVSGQHPLFPRRAGLWMALGLTALAPGATLAAFLMKRRMKNLRAISAALTLSMLSVHVATAGAETVVNGSPNALIATTDHLFFTENGGPTYSAAVYRASKEPTPESDRQLLYTEERNASVSFDSLVYAIEADVPYIYFVANYDDKISYIKKVPAEGGAGTFVTRVPYIAGRDLKTDGSDLYWADKEAIRKVPIGGGPITILARTGTASQIALDANYVYFTSGASGASLYRVPKAGGAATIQARASSAVTDLYVHESGSQTTLYWSAANAAVQSYAVGDNTPITYQPATQDRFATSIGFDGVHVLWTDCTTIDQSATEAGTDCRVNEHKAGVTLQIYGDHEHAGHIVADPAQVFWSQGSGIQRYVHPVSPNDASPHDVPLPSPEQVAVRNAAWLRPVYSTMAELSVPAGLTTPAHPLRIAVAWDHQNYVDEQVYDGTAPYRVTHAYDPQGQRRITAAVLVRVTDPAIAHTDGTPLSLGLNSAFFLFPVYDISFSPLRSEELQRGTWGDIVGNCDFGTPGEGKLHWTGLFGDDEIDSQHVDFPQAALGNPPRFYANDVQDFARTYHYDTRRDGDDIHLPYIYFEEEEILPSPCFPGCGFRGSQAHALFPFAGDNGTNTRTWSETLIPTDTNDWACQIRVEYEVTVALDLLPGDEPDSAPPLPSPPLPNLRGHTVDEAGQILGALGLVVGDIVNRVDPTCNNLGLVTGQLPTPGTQNLPSGSAIRLYVGVRPAPPRVCN